MTVVFGESVVGEICVREMLPLPVLPVPLIVKLQRAAAPHRDVDRSAMAVVVHEEGISAVSSLRGEESRA